MDFSRKTPAIPSDHLQPVLRLLRRAVRFWAGGLVAFVVVLAAAVGVNAVLPKQYRSEAVVYYREGLHWATEEGMSPRRIGQRLKDVLLARVQLAKVVDDLGLYPDLVKAGRTTDAIEKMRAATTFKFADGDVFVISFTGDSPTQAQSVTARLTEVLITQNTQQRSQQAEVTREFLDAEKKRKAEDLAAKEAEQLRFLAKHPEFAQEPSTAVGVTLRARPRGGGAQDDSALGALRREEQRLRRQLRSPGQVRPAPVDPLLVAAKKEAETKMLAAQRDLADRRARFTEQHPDVRLAAALAAQAEEAYRRAAEEVEAAQRPVPATTLRERLAQVEKDIAAYEREHPQTRETRPDLIENSDAAKRIVAVETEWARLSREVAEARERLQALDTQQFVASMTASMLTSGQTAQIVVIDPAYLPANPIGWSWRKRILASVAVALSLGVGLALALALLDSVIYDRGDVERLGIAPVLTEVAVQGSRSPARGGGADRRPEVRPREPLGAAPGAALAELRRSAERPRLRMMLPEPEAAVAARAAADPARALAATSVDAAREPTGGSRDAESATGHPVAPLLVPSMETSDVAALPVTTVFSFESDFSDLVRIHRVPPPASIDGRLVMLSAPDSDAAASFRVLRHRLGERRGAKTIMVASPRDGEGKTTTAVNLALALGETGLARVLLLEANFRTPAVAHMLGFEPSVCLTRQFEIHHAQPTEPWFVVEVVAPWLHVAAVASHNAARPMLDARALALCVEDLQAGYDYVVIDSPAILNSADANLIEERVDGILITLWARSSNVHSFRKAVDQVGKNKLLGVVLLGA